MMPLALPTPGIIRFLGHRVVECGAGAGLWALVLRARGADVVAIDPEPRGRGVIEGDHRDLAAHADRALLVVWPPDGTDVTEWLAAWGGRLSCIVGSRHRFTWPSAAPIREIELPPGGKGASVARFYA